MVAHTLQVKKSREFKDIAIETTQKGTQEKRETPSTGHI